MKKVFAVAIMLLMVLCSFQLAVSAQPTQQSRDGYYGWPGWHNQVGPQPSFAWRQIDEGQRYINSNTKIKWVTYKFRYNNNRVWINSSTYNKTNTRNNNKNWNNRDNWYWNNWNNQDNWNNNRNNNNKWNLSNYTITQLDKLNWRTLRITKNTYNATGGQIGTTSTRYVNTRYDAVRYYWRYRYWLVTPHTIT